MCLTLCNPMNRSMPGLPAHHQLPESTQTHIHRVGDAIQDEMPSHPLLSPSPPAPNPPSIRVFSNESALLMRGPRYWSFSFSISPSNEHPGLISFRMHWLLGRCKEKTHWIITSHLLEWLLSKGQEISSGEDVEKRKPSYILWDYKLVQLSWKPVWWFLETWIELPYNPTIPLLGIIWRKQKH